MSRKTLRDAFGAGFLAGMTVVHSQSLTDQENDFWKEYCKNTYHWCTKVLKKYQDKEMEESMN